MSVHVCDELTEQGNAKKPGYMFPEANFKIIIHNKYTPEYFLETMEFIPTDDSACLQAVGINFCPYCGEDFRL